MDWKYTAAPVSLPLLRTFGIKLTLGLVQCCNHVNNFTLCNPLECSIVIMHALFKVHLAGSITSVEY